LIDQHTQGFLDALQRIDARREKIEMKKFSFGDKVSNDPSKTNRWLTPHHIVEALGKFDLDPCGAPGHTLAPVTYQLDDGQDGLELDWFGRVWLNPPYGKESPPFLKKMSEHKNGIAFIFARTETKAFFEYVWNSATAVLFLKGRVKFLNADYEVTGAANAPSVLIAYSDADADALQQCSIPGHFIRLTQGDRDAT
jgi:hypothetical protein